MDGECPYFSPSIFLPITKCSHHRLSPSLFDHPYLLFSVCLNWALFSPHTILLIDSSTDGPCIIPLSRYWNSWSHLFKAGKHTHAAGHRERTALWSTYDPPAVCHQTCLFFNPTGERCTAHRAGIRRTMTLISSFTGWAETEMLYYVAALLSAIISSCRLDRLEWEKNSLLLMGRINDDFSFKFITVQTCKFDYIWSMCIDRFP